MWVKTSVKTPAIFGAFRWDTKTGAKQLQAQSMAVFMAWTSFWNILIFGYFRAEPGCDRC